MSESETRTHNIALLYLIHKEIYPDDFETTLIHIAANYDKAVSEVKDVII